MPDDFDALFEDVASNIGMIIEMTQTAIKQAEPKVDWIIKTKSKNSKLIESLLDRLMDYSLQCPEEGLPLFKKLLRYYLPINPPAVAEYIKGYHDLTTPLDEDDLTDE
jgi:hypothetical protein